MALRLFRTYGSRIASCRGRAAATSSPRFRLRWRYDLGRWRRRGAAGGWMSSVQTVTILITDLVGSTALESRIGPAAADALRTEHFSLLRSEIGEASGQE